MQVLAHSFLFWTVLIMALLALYILPTLIAAVRGTESLGWIIVINLLPTGIGWFAALIAAVALPRRSYPEIRQPACLVGAAGHPADTSACRDSKASSAAANLRDRQSGNR